MLIKTGPHEASNRREEKKTKTTNCNKSFEGNRYTANLKNIRRKDYLMKTSCRIPPYETEI